VPEDAARVSPDAQGAETSHPVYAASTMCNLEEQGEEHAGCCESYAVLKDWSALGMGDIVILRESLAHYGHFGILLQAPDIDPFGKAIFGLSYLESDADEDGLTHEYIYVDSTMTRFGRSGDCDRFTTTELVVVELWGAPPWLRRCFDDELGQQVVNEMIDSMGAWSYSTVAVALAATCACCNQATPEEAVTSDASSPICTTVALRFWQRYLHLKYEKVPDLPITRTLPGRALPAQTRLAFLQSGFRKLEPDMTC